MKKLNRLKKQDADEKPNQMIAAEEETEEARAVDVKLDSAMETKFDREEQRSVTGPDERKSEINSFSEASKVNEHDQETSPGILQKNIPEEESSENLELVASQSSNALSQTEVGIPLLVDSQENTGNDREQKKEVTEESPPVQSQDASNDPADREQQKELTEESTPVESQDASSDRADSGRPSVSDSVTVSEGENFEEHSNRSFLGDQHTDEGLKRVSDTVLPENELVSRPIEATQRGDRKSVV